MMYLPPPSVRGVPVDQIEIRDLVVYWRKETMGPSRDFAAERAAAERADETKRRSEAVTGTGKPPRQCLGCDGTGGIEIDGIVKDCPDCNGTGSPDASVYPPRLQPPLHHPIIWPTPSRFEPIVDLALSFANLALNSDEVKEMEAYLNATINTLNTLKEQL